MTGSQGCRRSDLEATIISPRKRAMIASDERIKDGKFASIAFQSQFLALSVLRERSKHRACTAYQVHAGYS